METKDRRDIDLPDRGNVSRFYHRLLNRRLISSSASVVSFVRGTMFFIYRDHRLNKAYQNYLDIVLTATEASASLMCACLPLTKPIVARITTWLQKIRGKDTGHQGWTTISASDNSMRSGLGRHGTDRIVTNGGDHDIQLLTVIPPAHGKGTY